MHILIICSFNTLNGQPPHPVPPPVNARHTIPPAEFNKLLTLLDQQTFNDDKMLVINAASVCGYFTCSQAATLMSRFEWSDQKLKALEYVAPHIVDIRGADIIFEQFTFDSEKQKVWNIISKKPAK